MFTAVLYAISISFLLFSLARDRKKTKTAVLKAWKSFANLLPAFLGVLSLVGLVLTVLNPDVISRLIGAETGFKGMMLTSAIGAVTLVPGFVAFPLAASLLERGAGIMQLAVFISTLMMVGVVTLPLEISYFGRKEAFLRNAMAYLFSFLVAFIIGMVVS
ncbi:permease [Thermosediminibacter litoriperuensis]|uniref:Permease n=1 Tax=Thermosediminibacter litoriperuensis TaxID=291989 RepID=A0A5S5AYW8_9FIRM|nr:permease [Thermosediminibacter litoriperuensis]TYP58832.1 hypothetical protein LZ11_00288 [Thermosediminibacter litoriperuensis]